MRYSERARQAIHYANQEAARLNHDHINTGHLLLGLIRQGEGAAVEILKDAKINLEKIRAELEGMMDDKGRGTVIGKLQLSDKADEVLKLAEEESRNMGHKYIGTEHLLLGLIREHEGVAARVLIKSGVEMHRARAIAQTIEIGEEEYPETLTFHNIQFAMPASDQKPDHSAIYEKDVLSLEEASRLLRITVDDLKKLLKTESIPARLISGQWRFSRIALIKWLGEGRSQDYKDQ